MPKISIVVAVSNNGVIGRNGDMPWKLSTDLKRFKALTLGKPLVMGRKTFEFRVPAASRPPACDCQPPRRYRHALGGNRA